MNIRISLFICHVQRIDFELKSMVRQISHIKSVNDRRTHFLTYCIWNE